VIRLTRAQRIEQTERVEQVKRVERVERREAPPRSVPDEKSQTGRASAASASDELRDHFIGWQCRLRQLAVRRGGGRPSAGMRPRVSTNAERDADESNSDRLVVLIVEREPERMTAHLRHLCRRTNDPRDRYNQVLSVLRAGYYQYPNRFSDAMTALFSPGSARAARLLEAGSCVLHFEQYSRGFRLPCRVEALERDAAAYQATWWHNAVFNPALPAEPEIHAFHPSWEDAATWQAEGSAGLGRP
jgi:hypothetical protein